MALTDRSDLYGAVLEAGVNRVIQHLMRQRPSLFNYGTAAVARQPELLCAQINAHPVVIARGNPLITIEPPLPVVGTGGMFGLNYALQLTVAEVDFSPGNVIELPPELAPPLAEQRFALHGAACAGLGCPSEEVVESLRKLAQPSVREARGSRDRQIVIPSRSLECFCLDMFMVGGAAFVGTTGDQHVRARLDGLELVDLRPEGLESSIECYIKLVLELVVLPKISVPAVRIAKDLMGKAKVNIEPTPASGALPNNPALEEDQVKIFLDLTASPPGPPGPPAPPAPAPPPGVVRPRTRIGPFDAVAAVSERAVVELFDTVRDAFRFFKTNSGDFGPFSLSYTAAAHLENGTIDLRNDGTISISELDIKWDTLEVCFGIDIPEICVGGFCLVPIPFDGCAVRLPKICVFSADPDISFCLDIGGIVTSEISVTVRPLTKYAVDPARTAAMNDWDAKDAGIPNHWQILIDPVTIDFDLFDIAAIVSDLLRNAVEDAIDNLLGPLPGWAKDLILALLGPVFDAVEAILDFGDDLGEWLSDKLGVSLGLFNFILTALADHFASKRPLAQLEDPFPLIPAEPGRIAVLIPIEFLGVRVDTNEMTLEADIGG